MEVSFSYMSVFVVKLFSGDWVVTVSHNIIAAFTVLTVWKQQYSANKNKFIHMCFQAHPY